MSRTFHKQNQRESKRRRHEKYMVEDERGWAGQYGQRPANNEERNYRPQETNDPGADRK